MAILEARGLVKYYGRRKVVDGVNFNVDIGEVVGLLGPNGAGKTTSFRMTTGQVPPNEGQVTFNGEDVTALPMFRRARLGMGYLPQENSVFRKLSVEQNILAILEAIPFYRPLGRKLSRSERWDHTDRVLEQFGLTHLRKNNAARLSGGEKRRLEIARCLVCAPMLILLDEPFTGIDPPTIKDIKDIIRALRNQNIGILVTDHQVREILSITDRSYLIHQGRVFVHGTPQQIVANVEAKKVYIGHAADGLVFENEAGGSVPPASSPEVSVAASPPATPAPPPKAVFQALVEQDRVQSLMERLRTADYQAAAAELLPHGPVAVPALIDALDWPQAEHRRRALEVLRVLLTSLGIPADPALLNFDPTAPEALRQPLVLALRQRYGGRGASGRIAS
jgi:lipopolysaccharide export system ATP-binding protein